MSVARPATYLGKRPLQSHASYKSHFCEACPLYTLDQQTNPSLRNINILKWISQILQIQHSDWEMFQSLAKDHQGRLKFYKSRKGWLSW